jgi:cephalosporin-C deacetylase-like acetyl esterase
MKVPAGFVFVALGLSAVVVAQTCPPEDEWTVAPCGQLLSLPNVVPASPALVKSLGDAAEYVVRWKPPVDAQAWRRRRPEVERAFRKAIGLEMLPERTPLNARVVARHEFDDYVVENVIFESRPGFLVTANLYRSKVPKNGKKPAILCPIGHYLTAGKAAAEVQARCIKLARLGFVVLTYDAIGQGERLRLGNIHHEAGYALLPLGETIAGWMVWDSMRAIDYLLTLPDVDGERIGMTGNSGGGLNTLFTSALDERVRAAVVVGYTFEFNNWLKYAGAHCTCTHLPGLFRSMEWFEIAGLIAPRALMMLQGDHDGIFPISGARRAGGNAESIYALLGQAERARFVELPGQPHAYSRPYREQMYGWMVRQLLGQGDGSAIPEGEVATRSERDPALLCDPSQTLLANAPTVVDLARRRALSIVAHMPVRSTLVTRTAGAQWVRDLTAPPEARPHFLAPASHGKASVPGGQLEKISFVSEDGEYIPGILWLPLHRGRPARTVIVVDSSGKQAVAKSGLVQPLLAAGLAVLAVDLRGRGETLGVVQPGWDLNYRLVANQVLSGQPLAGRRAFDILRTMDYVRTREELASSDVTLVGLNDDALPALLAAAADVRIGHVAVAGYVHSFVSQMREKAHTADADVRSHWNDAQLSGQVDAGDYTVDLGAVIPSVLKTLDLPDILALIAPRKVLFCRPKDAAAEATTVLAARFRQVAASRGKDWIRYEPGRALDGALLLEWLQQAGPR